MNTEKLQQTLSAAVCRVLEDAVFVFAEPPEEPDETAWTGPAVRATIEFTGPLCGRFEIYAPPALCAAMSGDMLGEPGTERENGDILGELLNMAAGIVLEEIMKGAGEWTLKVPEVKNLSPEEAAGRPTRPSVLVRLRTEDGEPVEAAAFLTGGGN